LPIASFLLAILALVLTLLADPIAALLVALIAVFAAMVALAKIRKVDKELSRKTPAASVIALELFILALVYWCFDAAPIPNDYTIADLRSAPTEYNQSYELLRRLADPNDDLRSAPAIGLSEDDVNALGQLYRIWQEHDFTDTSNKLKAERKTILQLWRNAERARDVITLLDKSAEIADLTEPDLMKLKFPCSDNLMILIRLYDVYVSLQVCLGNHEAAINELIGLHSIFKKVCLNSRSTIARLTCIVGLGHTVMTASFVANNPHTSHNSLEQLARHFEAPSDEHISLKNSIIFEYLEVKSTLTNMRRNIEAKLKYFRAPPTLKFNTTLRVCRNFCDSWIAREQGGEQTDLLVVWPALYPNLPVELDPTGHLPWYYTAYNPLGSRVLSTWTPSLAKRCETKTKMLIHYDLLGIVLGKRLGKEVSLKARAYSENYIIDLEKKKIFSPGPDGEAETEDDIELPIDPNVVDFTSEAAEKPGSL
jgi:hypothetical protein